MAVSLMYSIEHVLERGIDLGIEQQQSVGAKGELSRVIDHILITDAYFDAITSDGRKSKPTRRIAVIDMISVW